MSTTPSPTIPEQVRATRSGCGVILRADLVSLRLQGPDRIRFANGMLSNDVSLLTPGQAQRAVKADHKGKVQGVLRVRAEPQYLLLDMLEGAAPTVAEALVKLLIMDDATLVDATPERSVLGVVGPGAAEALAQAGYPSEGLGHLEHRAVGAATLVRDDAYGMPGYELHLPPGEAPAAQAALQKAGAQALSVAALEVIRVEAGLPIDGPDIDGETIPLEARLDAAISFKKGCYVGQEVIARAHNLGGVKHILVGLEVEGDAVPEAGAELYVDGVDKCAGEVTSAVTSPTLERVIAMGYLRVAHQAPGTRVRVVGSGPDGHATVCALPFV